MPLIVNLKVPNNIDNKSSEI